MVVFPRAFELPLEVMHRTQGSPDACDLHHVIPHGEEGQCFLQCLGSPGEVTGGNQHVAFEMGDPTHGALINYRDVPLDRRIAIGQCR